MKWRFLISYLLCSFQKFLYKITRIMVKYGKYKRKIKKISIFRKILLFISFRKIFQKGFDKLPKEGYKFEKKRKEKRSLLYRFFYKNKIDSQTNKAEFDNSALFVWDFLF